MPVDDPNTHLELTMIHEVMILDNSGIDLFLYQYTSHIKLFIYAILETSFFYPFVVNYHWLGIIVFVVVIAFLSTLLAVAETIMARVQDEKYSAVSTLCHSNRHSESADIYFYEIRSAMQNVLSILFCLSLFYLAATSRVRAYVTILRIQGILLTLLILIQFNGHFSMFALILPATLFIVKVILIPRYIDKIILRLDIKRTIEPIIQQFTFLLLVIVSMSVIFTASHILSKNAHVETITFATGFSAIAVGMFTIIFRKKLIIHVAGLLVLGKRDVYFRYRSCRRVTDDDRDRSTSGYFRCCVSYGYCNQ